MLYDLAISKTKEQQGDIGVSTKAEKLTVLFDTQKLMCMKY